MNPLVILAITTVTFVLLAWLPGRRKFHPNPQASDDADITVIISTRSETNSELCVRRALEQVGVAQVFLVTDGNFSAITDPRLTILQRTTAPTGWNLNRWGQQQALAQVTTPYVLFLDNDIELVPFTVASMREKLSKKSLDYFSLAPAPRLVTGLERALLPISMFLNRLRYPWIVPRRFSWLADVSSQCLIIQLSSLEKMDGVSQVSNSEEERHWGAVLNRHQLRGKHEICHAARQHTAVTQLSDLAAYGVQRRLGTLIILIIAFWSPLIGLFFTEPPYFLVIFSVWTGILCSYLPTLRYYNLHPVKLLLFPGAIFLLGWIIVKLSWGSDPSSIRKWRSELIETGVET